MNERTPSAHGLPCTGSWLMLLWLILFLCLVTGTEKLPEGCVALCVVWASTSEPDSSQDPSQQEEKGVIDSMHEKVSAEVLGSAVWLDSFFDDERVVEEENTSTLRLYGTISKEKDDSIEYNTQFRLRLVLPHTKKRLKLVISGNGEDELDPDNTQDDNIREGFEKRDEQNVSLALWYSFLSTSRQDLSFSVGLRLRSASPVIYAGPRYRRLFRYGLWRIRFIETLRYYSDDGWESKTSLDFERSVFTKCLFRTNIEGSWFEGTNGYFYNVNFLLYHPLTLRKVLVYEWANSVETRPSHRLSETVFRVRYRQRIWREWLFFETGPQVSFPRERDFDATPGIYVRLEAIFGKIPDL